MQTSVDAGLLQIEDEKVEFLEEKNPHMETGLGRYYYPLLQTLFKINLMTTNYVVCLSSTTVSLK